jgi:beta-N-acetylhexosaminidase
MDDVTVNCMDSNTHQRLVIGGQHLVLGLEGTSLDEQFINLIKNYKISNVILEEKNFVDCKQARSLCSEIYSLIEAECGTNPLIIASLDRLKVPFCTEATHLPSLMKIAATGDLTNAYSAAKVIATELSSLGINMIFTSALEVLTNRSNKEGINYFSDSVDVVNKFGFSMLRGFKDASLATGSMHFPGLGYSEKDPYTTFTTINRNIEQLNEAELKPYLDADYSLLDAVMLSPAHYTSYDESDVSAFTSFEITTRLLRDLLNFDKLIFSPNLAKVTFLDQQGFIDYSFGSLYSGSDMVIVGDNYQGAALVAKKLYKELQEDNLNSLWQTLSIKRIQQTKEIVFNKPPKVSKIGSEEHISIAKAISERGICVGNPLDSKLPSLQKNSLFLAPSGSSFSYWMAQQTDAKAVVFSLNPESEEILNLVEKSAAFDLIVIALKDGYVNSGQLSLANALGATGIPTIALVMGVPYDIPFLAENIYSFALFDDSVLSYETILSILKKERAATGILPIHNQIEHTLPFE